MKFILIFFIIGLDGTTHAEDSKLVKFTNLECRSNDKTFANFQQCQLKVLGRDKVALYVHMQLLEKIDDNIMLNLELFRKSHDFRPFLYNDTLNFCGYLRNPKRFMFWKVLVEQMIPFTNLNHTCPYEHDIIMRDMILSEDMLKNLEFPSNEYMIQVKAIRQKTILVEFKIFIVIKDVTKPLPGYQNLR